MAQTIKLYPFGDGTIGHTKSSNNSTAYSLVNETTNNTTGYLAHNLSTSSSTQTSILTNFSTSSNVTINNKVRINSIDSVNYYITTYSSGDLTGISLNGTVTLANSNKTFTSSNYTSNTKVTNSAQTLQISNGTVNEIYNSFSAANISLKISSTGAYSNGGKNAEGYIRIYNANITVTYDNVWDCKAEIITGYGVASATPSLQEVVEGDSCTFTATMQSGWAFEGWYDNPDFTGTKLSSSASYTKNNITANTTLYPKGVQAHIVHVYGDTSKFSYAFSGGHDSFFENDTVTLTITTSNSIYFFSGIYEADSSGNKLSTLLSSSNPYTFTMPGGDVHLYVVVGKKVNIYVTCQNCSLSSGTSPIQSSSGKTETITITYDSSTTDWSGIYSDSACTNRLSNATTYTFLVGDNDVYLYAKAILKQQIYVKENGTWVGYSEVYVKENGVWVKKDDYEGIFDTTKKYKRIEV